MVLLGDAVGAVLRQSRLAAVCGKRRGQRQSSVLVTQRR